VLDADVSKATRTNVFAAAYPDRFINCGCAEANMIGVAAGLSLSGFTPFASGMAVFASLRALDQIRNTLCYPRLSVKIVATHGGITVGEDGPSHQAIEDICVMRSLPNMTVVVPADAHETRKAVFAAAEYPGPVYIRLGRSAVAYVTGEDDAFDIGKARVLREGDDIALIACGIMVQQALCAADMLQQCGVSARVVNMHTVKPIDGDAVLSATECTCGIVTAEEGSIAGGLGCAVLKVLAAHGREIPLSMVGISDTFAESGSPGELLAKYGLTADDIRREAEKLIRRKECGDQRCSGT
jgi:transketolase